MPPVKIHTHPPPTFTTITSASSTSPPEHTGQARRHLAAPSIDDAHDEYPNCNLPALGRPEACWARTSESRDEAFVAVMTEKSRITISHIDENQQDSSPYVPDYPPPSSAAPAVQGTGGAWKHTEWAMAVLVVFSVASFFVLIGLKVGGWLDWKGNLDFSRPSADRRRSDAVLRHSTSVWFWPQAAESHENEFELTDFSGHTARDIFRGRYNRVDLTGLTAEERRRAVEMLEMDEEMLRRWSRAGLV